MSPEVSEATSVACNESVIVGKLTASPDIRELPTGTTLASFSLTVRIEGQQTTSVPLTWFEPPDRVARWQPGNWVVAAGPVVRRFYHAGGSTASRTEVTVRSAELTTARKRSSQAVVRVIDRLEGLVAELS